ncbi:MAG: hypothetical protein EOO11_17465 [Chitinophagaceae bacterium]|nr:MAG: hypothetical protein EOO11_17465 [Chitinophagaceae bacterium]
MNLLLTRFLTACFLLGLYGSANAQSIYKVVNGKTVLKSSDERRSDEAQRDQQRRNTSYEREKKVARKPSDTREAPLPATGQADRERLQKEAWARKYEVEGEIFRSSNVAERNKRCMGALRKREYGLIEALTRQAAPVTATEARIESVRRTLTDLRLARLLSLYYLDQRDSLMAEAEEILRTVDSSAEAAGSDKLDELRIRLVARKWRGLLLAENPATARRALAQADAEIAAPYRHGDNIKYRTFFYLQKARALMTLRRDAQAARLLDSFRVVTSSLDFQPIEFDSARHYDGTPANLETRVAYWYELRGLIYQRLGMKDSALACFRKAAVRVTPFSGAGPSYAYDGTFRQLMVPTTDMDLFDFTYPLRYSFLGVARLGGYRLQHEGDTGFLCLRAARDMNVPEAVALYEGRSWIEKPGAANGAAPKTGKRKQ